MKNEKLNAQGLLIGIESNLQPVYFEEYKKPEKDFNTFITDKEGEGKGFNIENKTDPFWEKNSKLSAEDIKENFPSNVANTLIIEKMKKEQNIYE
ncbi:MAG: hypothetical protein RSA57_03730 [Cetobacterium sp.]|uniref:hypothetical protein n=1 Tax=Bacteria TaxID=2 RepID=UPI002FC64495